MVEVVVVMHAPTVALVEIEIGVIVVEMEVEIDVVELEIEATVIVVAQGLLLGSVICACILVRTSVDRQVGKLAECIAVRSLACILLRIAIVAVVLEPHAGFVRQ